MALEIERKFLVLGDSWRSAVRHTEPMQQGYLAGPPAARCSVRVRLIGAAAWLNVKSLASGIVRDEFEYPIPVEDARSMLANLAGSVVLKRRHHVDVGEHRFEIDEFEGDNAGLVVAEIELDHEAASVPRPRWLGPEVSALARYYNFNLAARPWVRWSRDEREARDA